jgi:hypothetical protein
MMVISHDEDFLKAIGIKRFVECKYGDTIYNV